MPVLEREDARPLVGDGMGPGIGDESGATPHTDGGPPLPPAFYWDDGDGDGDGDGDRDRGAWGRRVFAIVGIIVLLSMVISPVAANLLAGHTVH